MIKKIIRTSLLSIGLIPLSTLDAAPRNEVRDDNNNILQYSRAIGSFQYSNDDNKGFTFDALIPLAGNTSQFWFMNAQAYSYDNLYRTYGLGFGHRQAVNDNVYGVYAFYDKQRSPQQLYYDRFNVGFQSLGKDWAWNANLYWYGGNTNSQTLDKGISSASLNGNNIDYVHDFAQEEVYSGISAEIGRRIFDTMFAYAGYYSYGQMINGSKFRIEYNMDNGLTFGASTQFDKARGWLNTVNFGYWLGKKLSNKNTALDRMRAPIARDMTVAAYSYNKSVIETDPRQVYFVSGSSTPINNNLLKSTLSDGSTLNSNDMTLAEALASSKPGDFIFIKGDVGNIDLGGTTVTLDGTRQLVSGVDGLNVKYQNKVFSLINADTLNRPTFVNGGLAITGQTTLNNFDMDGTGSTVISAIDIENAPSVLLQNMNIENYQTGVHIGGSSYVTVNASRFNNMEFAIYAENTGNYLSVSNSTFNNPELDDKSAGIAAINIDYLSLNDVTINNFGAGVGVIRTTSGSSNADLINVNVSHAENGIVLKGNGEAIDSVVANIRNGNFSNNGGSINSEEATLNIASTDSEHPVMFNNNANYGLSIQGGKVTADNLSFTNNVNSAIKIQGNNSDVTINNSTMTNTDALAGTGKGVDFEGDNGTLTMQNVSVQNTDIGIEFDGENATSTLTNIDAVNNNTAGLAVGRINNSGSEHVTVSGGNYSNNAGFGMYVEGSNTTLLNINDATIDNNLVGLTAKGSIVNINNSVFKDNNTGNIDGTVEAGTLTRTTITINNSSLYDVVDTVNGSNVILSDGNIIIENPMTLEGLLLVNSTVTGDSILVKNGTSTIAEVTSADNNYQYQCDINDNTGTCTNIS